MNADRIKALSDELAKVIIRHRNAGMEDNEVLYTSTIVATAVAASCGGRLTNTQRRSYNKALANAKL